MNILGRHRHRDVNHGRPGFGKRRAIFVNSIFSLISLATYIQTCGRAMPQYKYRDPTLHSSASVRRYLSSAIASSFLPK